MHIKDAGYREIVWALYKAGSSAAAIGSEYNPHTDVVTIYLDELQKKLHTKVELEATATVKKLFEQGYDHQGLALAVNRIKGVE